MTYYGDDDHAPDYMDRGGRDTRDDWDTVMEGPDPAHPTPFRDAVDRLREREQTLEDNRTTWMYRAEAAEAEVARLREREAQLVESAREGWQAHADEEARVARLEEALEDIQALPASEAWECARRALGEE